jgi:hypothetical protein
MIDPFAKWSFTLSMVPFMLLIYPRLFIFTPLLCLASMILGIFSLIRIRNSRMRGKGFAIAGMAISFLMVVAIIGAVIYVGTIVAKGAY